MSKYQQGNFLQIPRDIFQDETFLSLSDSAKWLYFVLKEDEHRYSGTGKNKTNWFFRSNKDLANDCGWSIKKLERIKKELIESGLIIMESRNWDFKTEGKKSEKHISCFRMP